MPHIPGHQELISPFQNPFSGWLGQLLIPKEDREPFLRYQTEGGGMGYEQWKREGKPPPPVRVTQRTKDILARTGGVPPGVTTPPPSLPTVPERIEVGRAQRALEQPSPQLGGGLDIPARPTESPPSGFRWGWNAQIGRWEPVFTGLSPFQEAQLEVERKTREEKAKATETKAEEEARTRARDFRQRELEFEEQQRRAREEESFREEQLGFQRGQAQQQVDLQREAERARLSANPINWLQFAAFTGEEPVVQPWMIPLGFQNQGGTIAPQGTQPGGSFTQAGQQLQIGEPIPGLQGTEFSGLPQLRTPSAQLQARWGPTAQAQFLGFERARTGAAPQETQFRLGAGRAPTGRFGGFSRFR